MMFLLRFITLASGLFFGEYYSNIIEPKLMGNSMNLSALVTIIALSFWGAFWGATGMILSIPITVIMVIIFSEFSATKPVAIMLSEKGRISNQEET